ncbi:ATP binding protein, putative isoform 2 [Hibiscus syriacus]|uniref:ATP binding protein, putative isoform 2 n=1 Tax=Hibiscus syriacus TaxID=106335 RepID=A0A6A3DAF5_HIBSY|nr:ATP binding protein, putative isoform 2 [Hibiscus syriacus]
MEFSSMWRACASKRAFRIGVLCAILTPVAKVMAKRLKHTQNDPNEEHITINFRLCADLPNHGISTPSRCNLTTQHHLSRIPCINSALQQSGLTEVDYDDTKLRVMGSHTRNASSVIDMPTSDTPLPWMDPVSKSFSMASSVPEHKLVSGFGITGGSKRFYRVVHEPESRENDQIAYVNSKFQDMRLSGTVKGTSVPMEDASASAVSGTKESTMKGFSNEDFPEVERSRSGFHNWSKKDQPSFGNEFKNGCYTIFIENLPETIHWKRLRSIFCTYGKVIDAFIPKKETRKGKVRVSLAKYRPRQSYWRKSSTVVCRKSGLEDISGIKFSEVEGVVDEDKLHVLRLAGFTLMRAAANVVLIVFEDSDSLRIVKDDYLETLAEWTANLEIDVLPNEGIDWCYLWVVLGATLLAPTIKKGFLTRPEILIKKNDNSFFVSASDDSTVKVWDSRKLEKDISFRSRLTYHLEGSQALCTAMLQNSAQVVVGACIADIKKKDVKEGAILTLLNYPVDNCGIQPFMYSTQTCGIHLWDTRSCSNAWTLKAVPEEGFISFLVAGPCGNWFVSGSSRGVLTLWDLRFRIPVNSWQPLIYVAAGCNEVSLWNAEYGSCHQVFRAANYDSAAELSDLPWALAKPSTKTSSKSDPRRNANPMYRVNELNEPPPCLPGIRALHPLPWGDLLTGGTDLRIRCWGHCSLDRSYCICGPNFKGVGNDDFYDARSSFGAQVVQLTAKAVLAAAATDSAGCHHDSVLSLASVKLNQRLLISSSRDGAIKNDFFMHLNGIMESASGIRKDLKMKYLAERRARAPGLV